MRLSLRDGRFLDRNPDPDEVPAELVRVIEEHRDELCREWDIRNPLNLVHEADDE